jgi:mannose-1-phosphate guanylyltransferase
VKAVVLVGGFGTRLRPLTLHRPKQMLPVLDRPMIEWVLAHLAQHGVTEAVLALGYRSDAFVAAYPDHQCAGIDLRYAVEDEPLDTAGAIRFAAEQAGIDERFLVLNADVLTDLDIGAVVAFHEARGAEATVTLHEVDDPSRYGVVDMDGDGRVRAFVEKPASGTAPSHHINAGTYVLEPSVLERIEAGRRVSIERETFPALAEAGTLYAVDDDGRYWLDTGTAQTYLQANLDVIDGIHTPSGVPGWNAVDATACVAGTAVVERSVVGPGVSVGEHAEIRASVVLAGATIGAKARVTDSIVGPGASIGERATLETLTIIGDRAVVPSAATVREGRVPKEDS